MSIYEFDFPGGSKTQVAKAGSNIKNGTFTDRDLEIIDSWRAAHRVVLNTFQAILRNRTRGKGIIVAQRHKRKKTIFDKLHRLPEMKLSRMDDVAGCRLIFNTIEELYEFRESLHKARFQHQLRNDIDKYDYIKKPKSTGYRGIHDVYIYNVNSESGKNHKGLLIELQYRTAAQHAWATCVEIIGFITESQPKFQRGDKRYEAIMMLASEMIARVVENKTSCLPNLSDIEIVEQFQKLDAELGLLSILRGLNIAKNEISANKNIILIFSEHESLEIRTFNDAKNSIKALFELERDNPDKDVVLVRADSGNDIRLAFKNYFSDAEEFINMIQHSCASIIFNNAPLYTDNL